MTYRSLLCVVPASLEGSFICPREGHVEKRVQSHVEIFAEPFCGGRKSLVNGCSVYDNGTRY